MFSINTSPNITIPCVYTRPRSDFPKATITSTFSTHRPKIQENDNSPHRGPQDISDFAKHYQIAHDYSKHVSPAFQRGFTQYMHIILDIFRCHGHEKWKILTIFCLSDRNALPKLLPNDEFSHTNSAQTCFLPIQTQILPFYTLTYVAEVIS